MVQMTPKDMAEVKRFVIGLMDAFYEEIAPGMDFIQRGILKMKIDQYKTGLFQGQYTNMLLGLTDTFIALIKSNPYISKRLMDELGGRGGDEHGKR